MEEILQQVAELEQKYLYNKAILDERIKNKKELQKKCKELGYDPDKLEETLAELESKLEEYKTNLEELIVSLSKKLSEHDAQN